MLGDPRHIARFYQEFKDEGVFSVLNGSPWCISWRQKNVNAGMLSLPRTWYAGSAEGISSSYFHLSRGDPSLNLLANPLPLGSIECWTGLNGADFVIAKGELNPTRLAGKRKIKD